MFSPAQRAQIVAILDAADDLTIATLREDGWPQATTVSFVNDGAAIYFGTWLLSQKAQNITRDSRVSVTVNAPYKTWAQIKGVSLGGHARLVIDAAELTKISALMLAKFPQLKDFDASMGAEMAIFRIDAEVVSVLDYSKGFGHTDLLAA